MAEVNEKEQTLFQKEQIETIHKINEYKLSCEANIVACLYKYTDEFYNMDLTLDDFTNNVWRVYFQIGYDIVLLEKKNVLDSNTIELYLKKHPKLKAKYIGYGGFDYIQSAMKYIELKNFDGYVSELKKWNTVIKLCKDGFSVKDNLSNYVDMTNEEIYLSYEYKLNNIFSTLDYDIKVYDICDNIYDTIEKLDSKMILGLPYYNMQILSGETNGQYLGTITLLGGVSNVGKSTVARSLVVPSIIDNNEKLVIMVNEDSFEKWQREMLVWICNNVLKYDIQKHTVRDGGYTDEVKSNLYKAADWLKNNTNDSIKIIPFRQYKTSLAIKQIKKYIAMGVKYFMLDTFKMDAGTKDNNQWLSMQQSMVDIKDTIKAETGNVHILITFQLEKGSSVMRYYTQNNIGLAKNIVDVASTCIMVRDVYQDEYPGEKNAIKVFRLEGKNNNTRIPVKLDANKKYQIFFIVKNQEGAANAEQIVVEHDKSRNIIKEIGLTNISPNF